MFHKNCIWMQTKQVYLKAIYMELVSYVMQTPKCISLQILHYSKCGI